MGSYATERALRQVVGALGGKGLLYALVLLLAVSWLADGTWALFESLAGEGRLPDWEDGGGQLLLAAALLGGAVYLAGRKVAPLNVKLNGVPDFDAVPNLVLFLSLPGVDEQRLRVYAAGVNDEGELNLETMRGGWRMALLAIARHRSALRRVVVVPSSGESGTHRWFGVFRRVVERFLRERGSPDGEVPQIVEAGEWVDEARGGVDFHDAEAVNRVVEEVLQRLRRETGDRERDVIVDITGGMAATSAAAAAVCLVEGRRFEYVSTQDFRVRVYDVDFEA